MTADQTAQHLHNVLPEYLDGYLLVGLTISGEPLARYHGPDQEAVDRINAMLNLIVARGGLQVDREPA